MSETLDLFSAENGDSAGLPVPVSQPADQPVGVADSAGTSHRPAGAVRSWPDAVDTATASGDASAASRGESGGRPKALSAMLLPELQRVAQSSRHHRNREDAQGPAHRGNRGEAAGRGQLRATAEAQGQRPPADRQIRTSDNSVQRGAPAGAGADRTFERDAMESQTSHSQGWAPRRHGDRRGIVHREHRGWYCAGGTPGAPRLTAAARPARGPADRRWPAPGAAAPFQSAP